MTQEQLAEKMSVSRQTVSRWEAEKIFLELNKLIALSHLYSVSLDDLVTGDFTEKDDVYSAVSVRTLEPFRMARYVMISPNPEGDVNSYMENWAEKSGLLKRDPGAMLIGWDFPFTPPELQLRFNLRGYVAAYILPEDFETDVCGVEYAQQKKAEYAIITVSDPFAAAFDRIPKGYKKIFEYLQANGFREKPREDVLPCFEYVYEKNGRTFMDIFIHADSATRSDVFTSYSTL